MILQVLGVRYGCHVHLIHEHFIIDAEKRSVEEKFEGSNVTCEIMKMANEKKKKMSLL